jgi:hypothetical protein
MHPGALFPGAPAVSTKKKSPNLTVPQVQLLLCGVLPRRAFDAVWALEVVIHWQQRNYAAYRAHRKRRLAQLNQLL